MSKFQKYLDRPNTDVSEEHLNILKNGSHISKPLCLARRDVNKLLAAGYLEAENGYCRNDDGSHYVACMTKMPGVTLDMIDWWFWWHAAEGVRYRIWYPEMHYDNDTDFGGHYDDENLSYRQRLHLSTHTVTEDIGVGKDKIIIDFMSPSDFGYDASKLNPEKETIVCARVGSPQRGMWAVEMCHFVRVTDDGVEMRSRFWMGYEVKKMNHSGKSLLASIMNTSFMKRKLLPKNLGEKMFHHCSQEYHNLAGLLPQLYSEEA